jgi:hypothetical protein
MNNIAQMFYLNKMESGPLTGFPNRMNRLNRFGRYKSGLIFIFFSSHLHKTAQAAQENGIRRTPKRSMPHTVSV